MAPTTHHLAPHVVDSNSLECLWAGAAICGEGPYWDVDRQALYWVDIDGCKAHCYYYQNGSVDTWELPEKTGWLLPYVGRSELVAGCKSGIYFVDLEGGKREILIELEADLPGNRLNDAKIDIHGRLWTGTMNDMGTEPTGWLYRVDPDLNYSRWDGPYGVTNGPAISPDDSILYHVDTHGRTVYAFDKHSDGTIDHRRIFVTIDMNSGKPDGLTVDTEGFVWLAHWGGSRITRFAPDGTIDDILEIPVPQVTSCTFGGPNMDRLFITTAARNVDLDVFPTAGGLFCVKTLVKGSPSPAFGHS